jgi:L-lactate dehydrogenase (cytochrome)
MSRSSRVSDESGLRGSAMGEAGVTQCLQIIPKELEITMAFCGHADICQVDERILLPDRC